MLKEAAGIVVYKNAQHQLSDNKEISTYSCALDLLNLDYNQVTINLTKEEFEKVKIGQKVIITLNIIE